MTGDIGAFDRFPALGRDRRALRAFGMGTFLAGFGVAMHGSMLAGALTEPLVSLRVVQRFEMLYLRRSRSALPWSRQAAVKIKMSCKG
jgi:hypothetical protein